MNVLGFERLRPREVIIMRVPDDTDASTEELTALCDQLRKATGAGTVMALPPSIGLETLDDDAMRAVGWVRLSSTSAKIQVDLATLSQDQEES